MPSFDAVALMIDRERIERGLPTDLYLKSKPRSAPIPKVKGRPKVLTPDVLEAIQAACCVDANNQASKPLREVHQTLADQGVYLSPSSVMLGAKEKCIRRFGVGRPRLHPVVLQRRKTHKARHFLVTQLHLHNAVAGMYRRIALHAAADIADEQATNYANAWFDVVSFDRYLAGLGADNVAAA